MYHFASALLALSPQRGELQPLTNRQLAPPRAATVLLRGGSGPGGDGLRSAWSSYLHALETKPMRTKMATSAALSGAGDLIAQTLEASHPFSCRRLCVLVAVNVFYIVPVLTAFYAANEALVRALKMAPGWRRTGVQLAFDQLINAPIVIAGFFASFQFATAVGEALVGGVGLPAVRVLGASVRSQLLESWASTVIANWKVWVLPQLVNFALVPPFARVAFANVVALVWNVVLSLIANASR